MKKTKAYTDFIEWLHSLSYEETFQDNDLFFRFYFQLRCRNNLRITGGIKNKNIRNPGENQKINYYVGQTK